MEAGFNLQTPAGFRGVHPDVPIRFYHRHLPHWRQEGATYFVTFRLRDSLPAGKIQMLKRWRKLWRQQRGSPKTREEWEIYSRKYTRWTDNALDRGHGACLFQDARAATLLSSALQHFQNERYFISCFVVMPNHCHAIVRPNPPHNLERILQSWKGFVSRELGRFGTAQKSIWQEESFDRIVRDEEHLYRAVQYIGRNPAKARIAGQDWRRWLVQEWRDAGWRFDD